jgi:teichoic acid transport system permease protein
VSKTVPSDAAASSGQVDILQQHPDLKRIGVRAPLGTYLREAWDRRDFAYTIALGQLRGQNQNTVLGNLWHLLNPLMLAGVYYVVFGVIMGGRVAVHDNYAAFLIVGIFVFHFSQKVIIGGTRIIVANVDLIKNISFPRALLPTASTIQESFAQVPALIAMAFIVFFTEWARLPGAVASEEDPITGFVLFSWAGTGDPEMPAIVTAWWLLIIPIALVQSVFNLGGSLIVARLTFHFRDTEFILGYIMRLLFYTSGVFFGVELVAARLGEGLIGEIGVTLFRLNPFYGFIRLTREAVMDGTTDPFYWYSIAIWSIIALVLGFYFFRRRELEYSRA